MKLILHKVLQEPFEHHEYVDEDGNNPYCVVYLSEYNGEVEETEMLYDSFFLSYYVALSFSQSIEGVVIRNNSMFFSSSPFSFSGIHVCPR